MEMQRQEERQDKLFPGALVSQWEVDSFADFAQWNAD